MIRGKPFDDCECQYLPILNKVTAGAHVPRIAKRYRELLQVFGKPYMDYIEG